MCIRHVILSKQSAFQVNNFELSVRQLCCWNTCLLFKLVSTLIGNILLRLSWRIGMKEQLFILFCLRVDHVLGKSRHPISSKGCWTSKSCFPCTVKGKHEGVQFACFAFIFHKISKRTLHEYSFATSFMKWDLCEFRLINMKSITHRVSFVYYKTVYNV